MHTSLNTFGMSHLSKENYEPGEKLRIEQDNGMDFLKRGKGPGDQALG